MRINFNSAGTLLLAIMLITGLPALAMEASYSDLGLELALAAEQGDKTEARRLIQLKANVNWVTEQGGTPLIVAAQNGHFGVAKLLLDHEANVNAQAAGVRNISALFSAALNGHDQIVQLLLDRGAHVNMTDVRGFTPLTVAAEKGHLQVAKILLDYDASIDIQAEGGDNAFALFNAAMKGRDQIVQLLLNKGAPINIINAHGLTPLIVAAHKGRLGVVKILLEHGANMHVQAAGLLNLNITALRQAADEGHAEVVNMLLTFLPKAHAPRMQEGYFALHRSIGQHGMKASKDMRKLIADRFVDALVQEHMEKVVWPMLALQDKRNHTARDVAQANNHPEIADLIDVRNPKSQETIRKMIEVNVRQACKLHPLVK